MWHYQQNVLHFISNTMQFIDIAFMLSNIKTWLTESKVFTLIVLNRFEENIWCIKVNYDWWTDETKLFHTYSKTFKVSIKFKYWEVLKKRLNMGKYYRVFASILLILKKQFEGSLYWRKIFSPLVYPIYKIYFTKTSIIFKKIN